MVDNLGSEVLQTTTVESGARPTEIKTQFEEARKLGVQLINIDQDRHSRGYFRFRDDTVLGQFSSMVAAEVPGAALSEEQVLRAKMGSMGLTLEGARQIKNKDLIEPRGIRDDMESLTALRNNIGRSLEFAENLHSTNPGAFNEVAKKVAAIELGIKPEEVAMEDAQLHEWVKDTYNGGTQRLTRLVQALDAYLSDRY